MGDFVKPVASVGARFETVRKGDAVPPSAVPVSREPTNLVRVDDTGVYLSGDNIVSERRNNPFVVDPQGRIYFDSALAVDPSDKVISVSDNLLGAKLSLSYNPSDAVITLSGKNGKIVSSVAIPKPDAPSLGARAGQGIVINGDRISVAVEDNGIFGFADNGALTINIKALADLVAAQIGSSIVADASGVSTDPDNILVAGSDGKPYLPGQLGSL